MNMLLRLLAVRLRTLRGRRLAVSSVARTPFRVGLFDLDVFRHMNNGRYLSILDLGRMDLMYRNGLWRALRRRGIYPVVVSQTITYRRSLNYGQRFVVETRLSGVDPKSVYIEQRFVVDGEIYALAHVRGRFLRTTGGTVPMPEVLEAAGAAPPEGLLPDWVRQWGVDSALPPARGTAPSVWPRRAS